MIVKCSIVDWLGEPLEVEASDDGYRIDDLKVAPEVAAMLDAEILGPFTKPKRRGVTVAILIDIIRHAQGHECDSSAADCQELGDDVREQWYLPQRKTR